MRIVIELNWRRKPKKVKSIYPDIDYYLVDRITGRRIETVWK